LGSRKTIAPFERLRDWPDRAAQGKISLTQLKGFFMICSTLQNTAIQVGGAANTTHTPFAGEMMTTKSEHREYISSEHWQRRRKEFLSKHHSCNRCGISRGLANTLYDQDLNVHHRSYASKGHEIDEHLEALCRKCHDLETFGNEPPPFTQVDAVFRGLHQEISDLHAHYEVCIGDSEERHDQELAEIEECHRLDLQDERNYELKRQVARDRESE
jgi:hypothetical protein